MLNKKWFRLSKFSRRWFYPISFEGWIFLPCWIGFIFLDLFLIVKIQESLIGLVTSLFSLCVLIIGGGIFVQNKSEDPLFELIQETSRQNKQKLK